jgi:hypothetical protein
MKIRYELAIAAVAGIILGVGLCLTLMKVLSQIVNKL